MVSSSKGSGGAIIGSVLITLVIVAAGAYFGLPFLYPNLKKGNDVVVQFQYAEFYDRALIWDTDTTLAPMNNTDLMIDTQGKSYLMIEFSTILKTQYNLGVGQFCRYKIALVVNGVGNKTVYLQTVNYGTNAIHVDENLPFSLTYKTKILAAGSYNVSVYWYSDINIAGNSYLAANYLPGFNNSRSLMVTEYFQL